MTQNPVSCATPLEQSILKSYEHCISQKKLQLDQAQLAIIATLQALLEQLLELEDYASKPLFQRLLNPSPKPARNIYIYGDVGRGKSMLMDLFFGCCPIKQKRRVHFLSFMQEIHSYIEKRRLEKKYDALPALALKIRASTRVLCFDEFHVYDIADTMIMKRLFTQLFDLGLVIVATSNIHPNDLYRGGIQRESFLPFIELLQETSEVVLLNSDTDYRRNQLAVSQQNYYWPLGLDANIFLLNRFDELNHKAPKYSKNLTILVRTLVLTVANDNCAYSSYHYLCKQALGPNDYLFIAQQFEFLFIANIPILTSRNLDEAKRFVTLVDALYEHKAKLVCTAASSIDKLYLKGKNAFEFKRTSSRLSEMQTLKYWQTSHISKDTGTI